MSNISLPADTFNLFPASPANHVIRFARMPQTSFVIQEVNLPGLSAALPRIESGGTPFTKFAPTRLDFEPLQITFLIDEELRAHQELYKWLWGITGGIDRSQVTAEFINDQAQYIWPDTKNKQNALNAVSHTYAGLTIVNGSKLPILRILFYNVWISNLGGIQFSTTADTLTPLTAQATFEYDFYSMFQIRR